MAGIRQLNRPRAKTSTLRKIVGLGDTHGNPHPALLPLIIDQAPDLIIFGGDLFDLAALRPDPDRGMVIPFDEETDNLLSYLKILLGQTKARIVLMKGNHDHRFWRKLVEFLPPDMQELVLDPIDYLVHEANSGRVTAHQQLITLNGQPIAETRYLLVLGDAVFSHCNFTGITAPQKLLKWLDDWHRMLGWPEARLAIQFHTHQCSYQWLRGGHICLVEPGWSGLPTGEGYKVGYQAKWRPGTLGAIAFEQKKVEDEWQTVLQSIHPLFP